MALQVMHAPQEVPSRFSSLYDPSTYSDDYGRLMATAIEEGGESTGDGGEDADGSDGEEDEDEDAEASSDDDAIDLQAAKRAAEAAAAAAGTGVAATATPPTEAAAGEPPLQHLADLEGLSLDDIAAAAREAVDGRKAPAVAAAAAAPPPLPLPAADAVDVSDLPIATTASGSRGAARDAADTRSEASCSVRSTRSARGGSSSARALDAKERVKMELRRGRSDGSGGRSTRNEAKDREKRKMNSSMKKEVAGNSGW